MVNVKDYGALGDGVHDDTPNILAAFQAAEALASKDFVYFPPGTYNVAGSLPLSGFSSPMRGAGAMHTASEPLGTVIRAVNQSGPVIDFTGFRWPGSHRGRITIGGFSVAGDNVADPTKQNVGMNVPTGGSVHFTDIAISRTGGPCLKIGTVYLSDFTRVTLITPVGAKANDVPYLHARATNGCRFIGVGFRSMGGPDVGASGAALIEDNGTWEPHDNMWLGCWFEFLHVPDGGTLFSQKANSCVIDGFQFFDCSKEEGATNTSYIRLSSVPPLVSPQGTTRNVDYGGNVVRGVIPGRGTSPTISFDCGVDVYQSRNAVQGVKGYKGSNVRLRSGVIRTVVELAGGVAAAIDPAVIDESGESTNSVTDGYLGTSRVHEYVTEPRTAADGGAGPRIKDYLNSEVGTVWLGDAGSRIQSTPAGTVNVGALSVANAENATTPGSVTRRIEIFDEQGQSLGFLPVYSAIT